MWLAGLFRRAGSGWLQLPGKVSSMGGDALPILFSKASGHLCSGGLAAAGENFETGGVAHVP